MLTFVVGFGILGYLAYRIYAEHPPVPRATVGPDGAVLYTEGDVFAGQLVFEKYGLMEYGTIFGHGAYLGPDFTADYIERAREAMRRTYVAQSTAEPDARIAEDFKLNRWDAARDILTYTPAQVAAWRELTDYYRRWFGPAESQSGLRRPTVATENIHALSPILLGRPGWRPRIDLAKRTRTPTIGHPRRRSGTI